MNVQAEQDRFQQQINENFISLFDFIEKLAKENNISLKEAGLYLLPRINEYLSREDKKQISYELVEPPFKKYSLDIFHHYEMREQLEFLVRNGRFRSEKKAKKCGLLLSELEALLDGKISIQKKEYNQTERETHLQMIAILAEELAKLKGGRYKKANGLPNNLVISTLIYERAKEIEIEALTAKSADTYRKRLTEISKYYKGE